MIGDGQVTHARTSHDAHISAGNIEVTRNCVELSLNISQSVVCATQSYIYVTHVQRMLQYETSDLDLKGIHESFIE